MKLPSHLYLDKLNIPYEARSFSPETEKGAANVAHVLGFSESDATPILIIFVLMVIGVSIALSTAASWVFIKARRAETAFRFWHVAGINAGVNILTILIILAVIAIMRFS